jgi:hypothetical protein
MSTANRHAVLGARESWLGDGAGLAMRDSSVRLSTCLIPDSAKKSDVGLVAALSMGVGAMIGAGIFSLGSLLRRTHFTSVDLEVRPPIRGS